LARRNLRVIVLGLGPIGRAVAREVAHASDLELVAAIDPAPGLVGRDLGAVLGDGDLAGRKVLQDLNDLGRRRVDVAIHMAASRFEPALAHVQRLVERKIAVVSTCEELIAAPWRWPRPVRALDRQCRRAGVAVLATGVNPGFVMDLLPAALTNACVQVRSIRVVRHVDTSKRRRALQLKTGLGLTPTEFRRRARESAVGHVGLRDSLVFLMNHMPLEGEVGDERIRPILAKQRGGSARRPIEPGSVIGVHQEVSARDPASGRAVASFDLKMAYGLNDPHDEIRIAGDPPIHLRIEGGVPGDRATVGAVLSTVRYVPHAPPGVGT
jgi:4-hydroxy-tetrahydrodipicolinate reductase